MVFTPHRRRSRPKARPCSPRAPGYRPTATIYDPVLPYPRSFLGPVGRLVGVVSRYQLFRSGGTDRGCSYGFIPSLPIPSTFTVALLALRELPTRVTYFRKFRVHESNGDDEIILTNVSAIAVVRRAIRNFDLRLPRHFSFFAILVVPSCRFPRSNGNSIVVSLFRRPTTKHTA